ncbi:MAG: ComEC/Rec2 family competence protein [Candidatus Paceibacterota bacterium]|jgi:competence protein ComEC
MNLRSFYFHSTVFGFFSGIFIAFNLHISPLSAYVLLITSVAVFLFLFFYGNKSNRFAHPLIISSLFAIAAVLGILRMESREVILLSDPLLDFNGEKVTLVGTIQDDAEANDASVILKVYAASHNGEVQKIDAVSVLLVSPGEPFRFGETVAVEGILEVPENFTSKDGKSFDYVSYLRNKEILHTLPRPKVLHREEGKGSLMSYLYSVKRFFINAIEKNIPEPESALAAGVTISGKGALPKDVKEDFVDAGVIHIVVLSGYNIAIVVGAILSLFGFLGRKWSSFIALLGIAIFVAISGGAAPVVRSGIMAAIVLVGTLSYTKVIQNRALFGAAILMLLWNPSLLPTDASFALSFLATFAIVNVTALISPFFGKLPSFLKVRETLTETMATQIFVLPYLLYQIGRLSVIAPISNLVVLPLIPPIMFLTFIVGVIGFVPLLALPFAGALYLLCLLVIKASHLFASLPFAAFDVSISLVTMIAIYIFIFALGYFLTKKRSRSHKAGGING